MNRLATIKRLRSLIMRSRESGANRPREDNMRKLVLIIVAAAFAVTMANVTHAAPFANSSALRDAGDDVALTDKVAYVCTHWWNGYWHPYARCFYRAPLYYSYGCCYRSE